MNQPIDMKELMNKLENINETTSEQYEVMLDKAQELGGHIASNVILEKQMNPDVIYSPGQLEDMIDKHLAVTCRHLSQSAHKYLKQHLRGGPKGV